MAEGLSDLALRILAELPDSLQGKINAALRDDFSIETDVLAERLVTELNEGQRWLIAKAAVADRIDLARRRRVRHRETAASWAPSIREGRAERQAATRESSRMSHARDCELVGVPVETGRNDVLALKFRKLMDDFKSEIKLQVTSELLESEFALGDGQKITWGSATAEQHLSRAQSLERLGVGTLTTAARHRAAVDLLRGSGCDNLSQVGLLAA